MGRKHELTASRERLAQAGGGTGVYVTAGEARDRERALRVTSRDPEWFCKDFRALLDLLRTDKIHPVVAERLPQSDARHIHGLLEISAPKRNLVLVLRSRPQQHARRHYGWGGN